MSWGLLSNIHIAILVLFFGQDTFLYIFTCNLSILPNFKWASYRQHSVIFNFFYQIWQSLFFIWMFNWFTSNRSMNTIRFRLTSFYLLSFFNIEVSPCCLGSPFNPWAQGSSRLSLPRSYNIGLRHHTSRTLCSICYLLFWISLTSIFGIKLVTFSIQF